MASIARPRCRRRTTPGSYALAVLLALVGVVAMHAADRHSTVGHLVVASHPAMHLMPGHGEVPGHGERPAERGAVGHVGHVGHVHGVTVAGPEPSSDEHSSEGHGLAGLCAAMILMGAIVVARSAQPSVAASTARRSWSSVAARIDPPVPRLLVVR